MKDNETLAVESGLEEPPRIVKFERDEDSLVSKRGYLIGDLYQIPPEDAKRRLREILSRNSLEENLWRNMAEIIFEDVAVISLEELSSDLRIFYPESFLERIKDNFSSIRYLTDVWEEEKAKAHLLVAAELVLDQLLLGYYKRKFDIIYEGLRSNRDRGNETGKVIEMAECLICMENLHFVRYYNEKHREQVERLLSGIEGVRIEGVREVLALLLTTKSHVFQSSYNPNLFQTAQQILLDGVANSDPDDNPRFKELLATTLIDPRWEGKRSAINRLNMARGILESLINRDPDNPRFKELLATTLIDPRWGRRKAVKRLNMARGILESLINSDPDDNPRFKELLATTLIDPRWGSKSKAERLSQAEKFLREAFEKLPTNIRIGRKLFNVIMANTRDLFRKRNIDYEDRARLEECLHLICFIGNLDFSLSYADVLQDPNDEERVLFGLFLRSLYLKSLEFKRRVNEKIGSNPTG